MHLTRKLLPDLRSIGSRFDTILLYYTMTSKYISVRSAKHLRYGFGLMSVTRSVMPSFADWIALIFPTS